MNRFSLAALVFSIAPTLAYGDTPPVATMPAAPVSCTPPLMQPLPVTPTVPPPVGTCVTYVEKRPGLFQSLLGGFRTSSGCDTCTPTSCPAPKPIKISPPKACPADGCGTTATRPATGSRWDRFKTWLCWKPCNEQLLPAFTPEPYSAPLIAYFPRCEEPTPGLPCGTCGHAKFGKKCSPPTCATPACPTAYGPVVSPWVYAGTAPGTAPAPAPAAAQPQANLLARPFTTP